MAADFISQPKVCYLFQLLQAVFDVIELNELEGLRMEILGLALEHQLLVG